MITLSTDSDTGCKYHLLPELYNLKLLCRIFTVTATGNPIGGDWK